MMNFISFWDEFEFIETGDTSTMYVYVLF